MNKITSLPYLDRLGPERQEVFEKLKSFSNQFVLAGGTAIMLQIGHRLSFDFDCFSQKELAAGLFQKIKKVFSALVKIQFQTDEILSIKTAKEVEVTFVYHPFPRLQKPIRTSSISLFHLDDLVANKAYTIGRRGAWRDYVDLFFFLKRKMYSLEKIVKLAEKKFGGLFNEKLFLGQLVYFDDLEIVPTTFLKESYSEAEMKSFLEKNVENYTRKLIPL